MADPLDGGTVVDLGGYRYRYFTASGTLTFLGPDPIDVDYLVVGGGGGGGRQSVTNGAGGGGAGGVLTGSVEISANQTVTVGNGGNGATAASTNGAAGSSSSLGAIAVASGGGYGAGANAATGGNGASGGGGRGAATGTAGGSGTGGQGSNGGTGESAAARGGGGGGGKSGTGATASSGGGNGGAGLEWPASSGTFYGGGGGGGAISGSAGTGGSGVGGAGGLAAAGSNATANRGGGGGGSGSTGNGGNGSAGTVVVRYIVPLDPPTPTGSDMSLQVWRLPENEFVTELTTWFGTPLIDHPHSGLGAMDVIVPLDSEDLALIQCPATGPTDYIRFYDGDRLVGAGLIERIDFHTLDPAEGSKLTAKLAGHSVNAIFSHALVFPAAGVDRSPVQVDRLRSWQSADFNVTSWPDVKEIAPATGDTRVAGIGIPVSGPPAGAPQIPGAYWIWDTAGDEWWAPGGTVYAVRDFFMAASAEVEIGAAVDNHGAVWVDEIQAFTFPPDGGRDNFLNSHKVTMRLSSGWHRIAIVAHNYTTNVLDSPTYPNPGTIFAYAATLDDTMVIDTVLTKTDDTWYVLGYPADPPGMTAGHAVGLLILEEQIRGRLTWLAWDWDAVDDSYEEPWNRTGEISTRCGNSLASFLGELQTSYIDWRVTPTCEKLEMVNSATYAEIGDSPILLEAAPPNGSANLGQLTVLDRTEIAGTGGLLVRWGSDPGGWSWVGGEGSAATLGVPHLTSRTEAVKQSTDELARLSSGLFSRKVSIDPTAGTRPGEAFGQGDRVIVEETEYRVNVVYTADAATGRTLYALTLGEPDLTPAARSQLSDIRMATGTVGRRSQIASPILGIRGTSVGDTPQGDGCCTSVFQGYGTGTLDDTGSDFVEISCPAPDGSQANFLYPSETGPTVLGAGVWMVSGTAMIYWDDPVTPTDKARVEWYPGVGPSTGVAGFLYGESGDILPGTEITAVNFSGALRVTDTWSPYVEVFGNYSSARTADVIVYLHAIGTGCGCATSVTTGGS